MQFQIEKWNLGKLLSLLAEEKINLNPPYQRNAIWTKSTQKFLIQSIKRNTPIPNIFLYLKDGVYEMVDGQQRTRAIKVYHTSNEITIGNDEDFKNSAFLAYEIPVTIITQVEDDESIEDFYYMVNTSGIKLNRPEEYKAHYFDKKFLKLVEELTSSEQFQTLSVIPATSQKRMLDRDLVEELCSLIIYGITDKKLQVDKIYDSDITPEDEQTCRTKFAEILQRLHGFNGIKPIKETRYRQRNDFYTLFNFIKDNLNIEQQVLDQFYQILLQLEKGFRPSKTASQVLADYAFNCVSQSNSAKARQSRLQTLSNLLLNENDAANAEQLEVATYYPSEEQYFTRVGKYLTFNAPVLEQAIDKKELEANI